MEMLEQNQYNYHYILLLCLLINKSCNCAKSLHTIFLVIFIGESIITVDDAKNIYFFITVYLIDLNET